MRATTAAAILLAACALPLAAQQPPPQNLQVLPADISRAELTARMRSIALGLGVRCEYCHVQREGASQPDFPSDENPMKLRAREMMRMTGRINGELLPAALHGQGSGLRIDCVTCHRGAPRPVMLADTLHTIIVAQGADSAVAAYRRLRTAFANRAAYDFGEQTLTDLGTRLAREENAAAARRILELNAEQYPDSWNVAFQLGLVYEALNERDLAAAQYRRALAINPRAAQVQRRLDALTGG